MCNTYGLRTLRPINIHTTSLQIIGRNVPDPFFIYRINSAEFSTMRFQSPFENILKQPLFTSRSLVDAEFTISCFNPILPFLFGTKL